MLHNARHKPRPHVLFSSNFTRLEKRKRVTLIAAFRCYEGAVLCADTMETVEGFNMPVHKLEAKDCGNYWLAIAGSGNSDLIDGFAYALELDIAGWPPTAEEKIIGARIKNVLIEFHRDEIDCYPADIRDETRSNFLVCIKPKGRIGLSIWELRGSTIKPAGDYSLMGIGATLYMHELRKLFNANNEIKAGKAVNRFNRIKALLLGIHLFSLAKGTSTYIGGDTDAVFVYDDKDMQPVDPHDIRILEARVSKFDEVIADIVLQCPDITTQDVELAGYLQNFTDNVMGLRKAFAQEAATSIAKRIYRSADSLVDAHLHIPKDTTITVNTTTGEVVIRPIRGPATKVKRKIKQKPRKQ